MKLEEINILTITDLERIETLMLSGKSTFLKLMTFASQFHKITPRVSFSFVIDKFIEANGFPPYEINARLDEKYQTEISILVGETFSD